MLVYNSILSWIVILRDHVVCNSIVGSTPSSLDLYIGKHANFSTLDLIVLLLFVFALFLAVLFVALLLVIVSLLARSLFL